MIEVLVYNQFMRNVVLFEILFILGSSFYWLINHSQLKQAWINEEPFSCSRPVEVWLVKQLSGFELLVDPMTKPYYETGEFSQRNVTRLIWRRLMPESSRGIQAYVYSKPNAITYKRRRALKLIESVVAWHASVAHSTVLLQFILLVASISHQSK